MALKVKICGVTSINHVKTCIKGKATMIGLMFYNKSPRYLNLELDGSNFLKQSKKVVLEFYEISKDVNKPTNNSVSLIQPIM